MKIPEKVGVGANRGLDTFSRSDRYVSWSPGEATITLDGEFTVADLEWFVQHIRLTRRLAKGGPPYKKGDIIQSGEETQIPAHLEPVASDSGIYLREWKTDGYLVQVTLRDGRVLMLDEPVPACRAWLKRIDQEWERQKEELDSGVTEEQLDILRVQYLLGQLGGKISEGWITPE